MLVAAITGLGKTVLLVVAITFIAWSIVTAIFVPKRGSGFPRRLDAFILVSAVLFVAQMTAVVWVSGTQDVEEAHASEAVGGGATTETTGTTTTEAPTTVETSTTPAAGDAAAGKQVFESAGCAACHTLADAGATGTVGPDLDQVKPPAALVVDRVAHGKGAMPSFEGKLSEEQIQDVAAYVSSVAGSS